MKIIVRYRKIVGFDNYRVGSDGSVWSLHNNRWGLAGKWKKLKCFKTHGYQVVELIQSSVRKRRFVHHLVLEAFVGPCPKGMECRHYPDRARTNNNLANLSWGTPSENQLDRNYHGTSNAGEANGRAILNNRTVTLIRCLYATGKYSHSQLMKLFHAYNISGIVNRRIWKDVDDIGSCVEYLLEEKHWSKSGASIQAPEFNFKGTQEKLIAQIEASGQENKLRELVTHIWQEIETSCEVNRRKRYE